MKLSILVPVYNEEKYILDVIEAIKNVPIDLEKEIIIIDDKSSDSSLEILQKYAQDKSIKIIMHAKNLGKGAAIREGLKYVTGDIVLIQDADMEYSLEDYPKILKPIISGTAKVVYGSRFLGKIENMHWPNWLANKVLTLTANILYKLRLTDEATAYKVFDAKLLKSIPLKCERFEFCPEITAKIAKRGYKIQEVPISYIGRSIKNGKKIKIADGFEALWTLIKYRFKD